MKVDREASLGGEFHVELHQNARRRVVDSDASHPFVLVDGGRYHICVRDDNDDDVAAFVLRNVLGCRLTC